MNTPAKLAAYALGLAAAFGAAVGVGGLVGPVGASSPQADEMQPDEMQPDETQPDEMQHGSAQSGTPDDSDGATTSVGGGGEGVAQVAALPGGLMVSQDGYTLALAEDALAASASVPVAFRVLGADGAPVTAYVESQDKDLHFIAVRRDLTGFQHVHPELGPDGTWRTSLALTPGQWRVFADFTPAGHDGGLTLGADLAVAGDYAPRSLPDPTDTATVADYTVTLDGVLVAGQESELTLSVSRDGQPVTDLEPYLAAYGHLVVVRAGDLAYLHVHPAGEPGDGVTEPGPAITFYATAPSAGDHRLFLDFQHEGVVHTAEFTARADGTGAAVDGEQPDHQEADGDDGTDGDEADDHGHSG